MGHGIWFFCPSFYRKPLPMPFVLLPSQECRPPFNSNIAAFALKAKVVYPINQKFRVSVLSSVLEMQLSSNVLEVGVGKGGAMCHLRSSLGVLWQSHVNRDVTSWLWNGA